MQKTRQSILNYLKQHDEATVGELGAALGGMTPVTVRHHLDVLRREGWVSDPIPQRRPGPGRPKFIYRLTDQAWERAFPQNYAALTDTVITQIKETLGPAKAGAILDGVAERMAAAAPRSQGNGRIEERLADTAGYLTGRGYEAHWEARDETFALYVTNCPYHQVAQTHREVCTMDYRLISQLLGAAPERVALLLDGDETCTYIVRPGAV